jgi:hypothetical protein
MEIRAADHEHDASIAGSPTRTPKTSRAYGSPACRLDSTLTARGFYRSIGYINRGEPIGKYGMNA